MSEDYSLQDRLEIIIKEFSEKKNISQAEFISFSELLVPFLELYNQTVSTSRGLYKDKVTLLKYLQELEAKDSVFVKIQQQYNPLDALELASSYSKELLGADRVTLWWYNEDRKRLSNHIAEGIINHNEFTIPLKGTLAGYSYQNKKIVNIKDVYHIKDEVPFKYHKGYDRKNNYKTQSVLCVPISYVNPSSGNDETAVLQLINKNRDVEKGIAGEPFTNEDIRKAKGLGYSLFIGLRDQAYARKIEKSRDSSLATVVKTIEARHPYTAGHSLRVSKLATKLASSIGKEGRYLDVISQTGILHDIGKIGISDEILFKKGKLNFVEFSEMKKHPSIGKKIVSDMDLPFKEQIFAGIEFHHEKLNGTGYPYGLKEDEIPLEARIMGIVDQFDALRSFREYRDPMSLIKVFAAQLISQGIKNNEIDESLLRTFISSDSYVIPEYLEYIGDPLLKERDLLELDKHYVIGNLGLYATYKKFLLDTELDFSSIKEDAKKLGHTIKVQKEHETIKQFLLHIIDEKKFLTHVTPDTSFKLGDILDVMTSKKYTNNKVSLGEFLSSVVPDFLENQHVSSVDVLDFIKSEDWRKLDRNHQYNKGSKFAFSDLSYTKKLINQIPDKQIRNSLTERQRYIKRAYKSANSFVVHDIVKSYYHDLFTQLSDSKYNSSVSSGFTFDDIYTLLKHSPHGKKSYSDEQIFFLVGSDAVKKGIVSPKTLIYKMQEKYTIDPFQAHKQLGQFRKFLKSKTKKHIQYPTYFWKTLSSYEKYYVSNSNYSVTGVAEFWFNK